MDNLACTTIGPIFTFYQSLLDFFFGFFSFAGISAPAVQTTMNSLLGCG
jgi:hypothetical protein